MLLAQILKILNLVSNEAFLPPFPPITPIKQGPVNTCFHVIHSNLIHFGDFSNYISPTNIKGCITLYYT